MQLTRSAAANERVARREDRKERKKKIEGEKGLQRDMTVAASERNGERGSQTCRRMQDKVLDYVGR